MGAGPRRGHPTARDRPSSSIIAPGSSKPRSPGTVACRFRLARALRRHAAPAVPARCSSPAPPACAADAAAAHRGGQHRGRGNAGARGRRRRPSAASRTSSPARSATAGKCPLLRLVYSPAVERRARRGMDRRGSIARDDPDFGSVSDFGDVALRAKVRFARGRARPCPRFGARFGSRCRRRASATASGQHPALVGAAAGLPAAGRPTVHLNAGLALQDEVLRPHEPTTTPSAAATSAPRRWRCRTSTRPGPPAPAAAAHAATAGRRSAGTRRSTRPPRGSREVQARARPRRGRRLPGQPHRPQLRRASCYGQLFLRSAAARATASRRPRSTSSRTCWRRC